MTYHKAHTTDLGSHQTKKRGKIIVCFAGNSTVNLSVSNAKPATHDPQEVGGVNSCCANFDMKPKTSRQGTSPMDCLSQV